MPAASARIHPGRWPSASLLDRASHQWRQHPLAQGLISGLLPAWGWCDYISSQPVMGYTGSYDLPDPIAHPTLGQAWDFAGSRRITLGNWGNEHWAGAGKAFSITAVVERINAHSGDGCIIAKADSSGMTWDLWALSTGGGYNRLQWTIRGAAGAYLIMYTHEPSFTIEEDRPCVITCTYDHSRSGSDRIRAYINGQDVSSGYSESGDFSAGASDNSAQIILGCFAPDNSYFWPGRLGGLWMHNRALTPAEVWQLYAPQTRSHLLPLRSRRVRTASPAEPEPPASGHAYYFRQFILRRSA